MPSWNEKSFPPFGWGDDRSVVELGSRRRGPTLPYRAGGGLRVGLLMTAALLASVTCARGQFVELNPPPSFIDGDPLTWTASMTVTGRRVVTLRVALPESEELAESLEPVGDVDARVFHRGRGHWEVHARNVNETTFKLTLQGAANRFRNAANVRYTWHVQGQAYVRRLLNGPVESGPLAYEAAASKSSSGVTADHTESARLRLFRDGNRILWGSSGGSRFEAQISGDVVLDSIRSTSLVEEALGEECLWASRVRSHGSRHRCEYAWDTETYASLLAWLRMQRDVPSSPVSPSFVPKLTVQRVGLKRLSRTTASMWVIRFVPIAHHSNGQGGCELVGQDREQKTEECVEGPAFRTDRCPDQYQRRKLLHELYQPEPASWVAEAGCMQQHQGRGRPGHDVGTASFSLVSAGCSVRASGAALRQD